MCTKQTVDGVCMLRLRKRISWQCHLIVQAEVYKLYGKAYGWTSLVGLCFFWASEQSTNILTSWWLSQWTGAQILYQIQHNLGAWPAQTSLLGLLPCLALAHQ